MRKHQASDLRTESARVSLGRDFSLYGLGQGISIVGDRIGLIALVFLVLQISRSYAPAVALFYICRVAPTLIGGLAAGILADHADRRTLLIVCDLGRAVLLAVMPGLTVLSLWTLYPAVIALYALTLVFNTAARAALPDIVAEDQMMSANSVLQAIDTAGDLAYALGGGLVLALGSRIPLYLDAATFMVSAAAILAMRVPATHAAALEGLSDVRDRLREGIRHLASTPFLRWSTLTFIFAPMAGGASLVLTPLYASHTLAHSGGLFGPLTNGAFRFGLLEVSLGMGALGGSLMAATLGARLGRGRMFGVGVALFGLCYLLLAASANLYWAALLLLVAGFFNSLFVIADMTLVQTLTLSEIRGRVIAARSTIINGALATGSSVAGVLLLVVSYRSAWLVIGAVAMASSLFVMLRPEVRSQP